VEEPDCALFLKPEIDSQAEFCVPVPVIDADKCKGHGRCQEVCAYNAIKIFNKKPYLFGHMCHNCGGCVLACPEKAITEAQHPAGKIRSGRAAGLLFADGIMNIGEASPVRLIKAVKKLAPGAAHTIVDCPPGTTCPRINAVTGADFCLLVSEPTPFGLCDLKLAVETLEKIKVPHALVINRADLGDGEMEAWCAEKGVNIRLKIPFDRAIAEAYSRGETLLSARPEYRMALRAMFAAIEAEAAA
jgi:MinD superfamily P-loop ATPase